MMKKRLTLLERRYKKLLLDAIDRQKRYPKRARWLGAEGEVVVSFTITANGEITDITLVESSDYSHLDRVALKAVEKVGELEPIAELLDRE